MITIRKNIFLLISNISLFELYEGLKFYLIRVREFLNTFEKNTLIMYNRAILISF